MVARIDTSGAVYAFELGAIANVNACRANTHAFMAINAITGIRRGYFNRLASWFSAHMVIGYDNTVFVEENALHSTIWAYDQARLLAKPEVNKKEDSTEDDH
jgi:hypothetical protein